MNIVRSKYEEITHKGFATVWAEDCRKYWGQNLEGDKRHYCPDSDYLPIDETRKEYETCTCVMFKEKK